MKPKYNVIVKTLPKEIWELKSPRGNSKNTIHNIIKSARKQSTNIIIDLRYCKTNQDRAISRAKASYKKRKRKHGTFLIIKKMKGLLTLQNFYSKLLTIRH